MSESKKEEEATSVPVAAVVPSDIQKAVTSAFQELVAKMDANRDYFEKKSKEEPKAWFADPFALLDSLGMGYRASPSYLTYETLRMTSERDTVVAAIIQTRTNQVAAFSRPQANKYSVGFVVRPRGGDKRRPLRDSEKERIREIEFVLLNTGLDYNIGRDSFDVFLRKIVRDRLTYDQACFEKVKTYGGRVHSFFAVPSDSIRIAHPKTLKSTPPDVADLKRVIKYVQLVNGQIVAEYTVDEMAFMVHNPRSNLKVYGYGFPEIEMLMTTVTSHMWAEEWNRRAFSQGSTVKGVLNLKGNIPANQFEAFKRQWYAQVAGIQNAWKTPVVNTDEIQWTPLQMSNTEMGYQMWMEYLVKVTSAIFQIDPAEINFDLRGGVGQQPVFMSTNEAQQKVYKDRGLQPLLRYLEDNLNRHIVWAIDPRFELAFVGLDAKTEEQAAQLRMQQVQNTHTLNEVRAMEDLPPVKYGDVVLNPTYTAVYMQRSAADAGNALGGAQSGPGAGPPPGPAGMPSGAPGANGANLAQPGGPPPGEPQGPYANQFKAKPPGDEEQEGADAVRHFDEKPAKGEESKDDDESSVSERTLRRLHHDDWSSSVHSAMKQGDLKKSEEPVFDLIDLE